MVRLRVDVEAENARRQFEQTARSVDRLGNELTDAQIEALRLEAAFDQATNEARQLEHQVQQTDRRLEQLQQASRLLGNMMSRNDRDEMRRLERQSQQLHRELDRTNASAQRLGQEMTEADRSVARLADELDDAEEEAAELRREMDRLAAASNTTSAQLRRAFAGIGDEGRRAGTRFAAGMGPAILGGVAALGPLVGAALDAGIVAALGVGVAGAGAALAVQQSDALQRAFGQAFAAMGDEAKVWARGFDDELFGVALRFRQAWSDISGDLGVAFEKAQEFVQPLADGLSQLVENMIGGGGFSRAMDAAGPVIDALAAGLSDTGDALDSFFDSLADGGDGAVKGMIALMALLNTSIRAAGNTIEFLSRAFDIGTEVAEEYAHWMEIVVRTTSGLSSVLPGVADAWGAAGVSLSVLNDEANRTSSIMPIAGANTDHTAGSMDRQAVAARKAAEAARDLSNKLHGLITDQLSADEAAIAWEQAIDDVTESIQQNGANIDVNTQKGRDNTTTVLQAIQAAEAKRQSMIQLAGGEKASAEAVAAANAAYNAQIDQLGAVLRQAGLTKAQVDQLLQVYRNIANAPDITKRILVYTDYRTSGDAARAGQRVGPKSGSIYGYASGTMSAKSGYKLVGEEGPELVRFKGGERVWNATDTARMMSGGYAGGGGGARGNQPVAMTLKVEAAPGHAGNPLVQLVLSALNNGQLRLKAGSGGRVVAA